jgi:multicomponent Na+:H+ antiporter subunit E
LPGPTRNETFSREPPVRNSIFQYLLHGAVLAAIWLLLSGHFDPLLLGLGLASVVLCMLLTWRMNLLDQESYPVSASFRYFPVWPWLGVEIVKSNLDVARRILSPSLPISPCVFELEPGQATALGRVVYANSITLTPGTLTLDVRRNRFEVHSLTTEGRDDLLGGRMNRRITRAEGVRR